ncbi:LOW QUALITY PROTEIN: hypothetical protein Cgig2_033764 [Carnegiea gigantea]|uniref:Uncharacterized protein n=1 Tax=Carnegiea gigantea TaxID=171969 RepID=A0A9Q1KL28_9CARY|nr:LOW QUALITY PROTEIN: hypothetical protein Cgig2_033764 [Carnegiea gigantea]
MAMLLVNLLITSSTCVFDQIKRMDKNADLQAHSLLCQINPPRRSTKPPSWLEENLKTGKIFLLLSHPEAKESVSSYQLLCHEIDAIQKSWEKLSLQGEFLILISNGNEQSVSTGIEFMSTSTQRQTICISLRTSIASSSAYFWAFFMIKLLTLSTNPNISLGSSCTHMFTAYHTLRQYQALVKFDQKNQVLLVGNIPLTAEAHGWNKSHDGLMS